MTVARVLASSQSSAAVSPVSFIRGFPRRGKRARLYTADAERLGRRVEDTHTRKSAIELEGPRVSPRLEECSWPGAPGGRSPIDPGV